MSTLKKLAGQTAIYGLSTIVARLLNYVLVPLYTYNFPPSEYGVVIEIYAYITFLNIVVTYGMETALFNFSSIESAKEKVYSTALISLLVSTGVFLGITLMASQGIARLVRHENHVDYIIYVVLIIGFDALTAIPFAKLREQNKAGRFAFIKTVNIIVNIALNVFFIVICKNHWGYNNIGVGYIFISNLVANLVVILFFIPEFVKVKYQFDFLLWKRMMKYALPLLLAGLAGMTNETMDRILLKYLLPAGIAEAEVGIYGACYKISIILTIFIQTFKYAAEPFFFSNAKEKNSKVLYAQVMKYFVMCSLLIVLATLLNLSWIQFYVGKAFRAGMGVVKILLLANLCLGVFYNLSIWYKLTNKTRFGAYLTGMGALITLVLNFLLIPRLGYMGAAWATLICYGSMMVVSYLIGNKHYPVDYNLKGILGYFTLSLTLYLISKELVPSNGTFAVFMNNILVLVYVLTIVFFERHSIKQYIKR